MHPDDLATFNSLTGPLRGLLERVAYEYEMEHAPPSPEWFGIPEDYRLHVGEFPED